MCTHNWLAFIVEPPNSKLKKHKYDCIGQTLYFSYKILAKNINGSQRHKYNVLNYTTNISCIYRQFTRLYLSLNRNEDKDSLMSDLFTRTNKINGEYQKARCTLDLLYGLFST